MKSCRSGIALAAANCPGGGTATGLEVLHVKDLPSDPAPLDHRAQLARRNCLNHHIAQCLRMRGKLVQQLILGTVADDVDGDQEYNTCIICHNLSRCS